MYTASTGSATHIAVFSFFEREIAFGTSSPRVTWRYVTKTYATRKAAPCESSGSSIQCSAIGSPTAPRRIEKAVIPSWTVPMNRTGLSMIRSATFAAVPAIGQLPETASTRRNERVLCGHEERVAEHDREDRDRLPDDVHAPALGAPVLGRRSLSKEARPEYR